MPTYRLKNAAYLRVPRHTAPVHFPPGSVVETDAPPAITWQPLDQAAIDAFQARHGDRRLLPNGLQCTKAGSLIGFRK